MASCLFTLISITTSNGATVQLKANVTSACGLWSSNESSTTCFSTTAPLKAHHTAIVVSQYTTQQILSCLARDTYSNNQQDHVVGQRKAQCMLESRET